MTSLHRDPKLRASDADRDRVAAMLRDGCAAGRLSVDELGDRLEGCYQAQTYGDLDALVHDLPAPDPYADLPVPSRHDDPTSRLPVPAAGRDSHAGAWATWGSVSLICWAIWLATVLTGGGAAGVWPVWVMLPWGGVLLAQEIGGSHGRRSLPPGGGR